MEADWEVEIGPDAPVIDALWPGFVDLRAAPNLASDLSEVAVLPGLVAALVRLNGASSNVWTSKCDVWPIIDRAEFDPYELDAPPDCGAYAFGCYIDILPRGDGQWPSTEVAVEACKLVCRALGPVALRSCRVDLIVRRAVVDVDRDANRLDLGMTAYISACGPTPAKSIDTLGAALAAFADALAPTQR
jgi:hypothetical protein